MLAINQRGETVDTCDFVQDHYHEFNECVRYLAYLAIRFDSLHWFMDGPRPIVRRENVAYLRPILEECRHEKEKPIRKKPLYTEELLDVQN